MDITGPSGGTVMATAFTTNRLSHFVHDMAHVKAFSNA
jgi:hypothetical protein|tara:strand:+ start:470 stop:583 length:114 start_codon:yes stop_codon:yes gene_type:complete